MNIYNEKSLSELDPILERINAVGFVYKNSI